MTHKTLSTFVAASTLLACVQVKTPVGGVGKGSRLSEITMSLPTPASITSKPEQQKLLSGFRFTIAPKTASTNCTSLDKTAAWADAKADAQILQGCDYTVSIEIGDYVAGGQVAPSTPQPPPAGQDQAGTPPSAAGTPPGASATSQPPTAIGAGSGPVTNGTLKAIYYKGSKDLLATDIGTSPSVKMTLEIYLTEQGKNDGFPGEPITVVSQGVSDVTVDVSLGAGSLAANIAALQKGNQEVTFKGLLTLPNVGGSSTTLAADSSGSIVPEGSTQRIYFTMLKSPRGSCPATSIAYKSVISIKELELKKVKTATKLVQKICDTTPGAKAEIFAISIVEPAT